ncbi:MAG TPA: two-component regulator propeller domain-containing protein [Terriglobales bacterium]|nr:two-component regulator propeller domain-containing protein [Terriglobales bacterium]
MRSLNTYREDGFGRRWLLRCAIAGLMGVCFAVSASAVDPTRTVSQYLHDSWGTERGLPGGSITAIAQTSDGYLWIGTDKGLVRFDGLNFHQFERAHPDPTLIGPIRTLLVDASDNLWILLQNTQLFRYHSGNFELIRGEAENGTTAMARRTSGAVLLSSLAVGTLTYSDNRFRTLSSAALLADAARVANGEAPDQRSTPFSWSYGNMPDRLAPTSLVISMAQTDDGKIWLGTERRGLFYLQEGRVSSASNGRDDAKINCLLPLQNSELWVGTAKGVLRWNGTELTLAGVPSSLLNLDVRSILRDRDSNIWVGTSLGLFRYNANGVSLLSTHEITGPVAALFEDREGNIWVGSARGLERLRDSAFVTYSLPNLKSQSMGPLHVDSGGRTWIAPIQSGLRWLKEGKSGVVTADGIANDVVYSIAGTGKDDVWVGRQQDGLTHLRYSGNSFTAKTYTQADGLAQNSVYAVHRTRDGTVWSGTLSSGVSKLKNGHFTNYTTTDGLAANTISSIAEGPDGTMWFGTPNGLSALTKKGWRTYTVSEGLASQDVNCLLQDSSDVLWIGTAEGLAYLRDGHVHVARGVPESLRSPIFGIEEDKNGWLWIATASKVLQVNRNSLVSNALGDADVREYGLADGLYGTEGVKRYQSVVADSQGKVWFSTNRGLSMVNPARQTVNSVPALVHIEGVSADGTPFETRGPIRVPAGKQRTTFRYVGLSLGNSERVRYRYMLEGVDHGWSEAVTNREATYGNLGSGSYRFRVMASNSDGQWNGAEAAVGFEMEPTLSQTWWFRSAVVLSVGLAALGMYLMRIHQLTRMLNARFEERLAERTRIAQDLHDTLLQGVLSASMQLHVVTDQLPSDSPTLPAMNRILQLMGQVIEEGRNTLRGLRLSMDAADDLQNSFSRIPQELGKQAVSFRVVVEGEALALRSAIRDDVYRIGREAVVNAFRHSGASNIDLHLEYAANQLRILVRDDGCGVDPRVLKLGRDGHWGLRGMRERAERIGARLRVWSRAGGGTEVELRVPSNVAFESHPSSSARKLLARLPRWFPEVDEQPKKRAG